MYVARSIDCFTIPLMCRLKNYIAQWRLLLERKIIMVWLRGSLVARLISPAFYRLRYESAENAWTGFSRDMCCVRH